MGRITIYLSIKDGELEYRDTESYYGRTIETSVDPGDKIIWTLDENSGIKDLSGINIVGSCKFLSRGPKKKGCDKWVAKVSRKAQGEIDYHIFTNPPVENSIPKKKNGDKNIEEVYPTAKIKRRI